MQGSNLAADTVAVIAAVMDEDGISQIALAERMKVNPMWVSRRVRGDTDLTLTDLAFMCDALSIEPRGVIATAQRTDIDTWRDLIAAAEPIGVGA